MATVSQLPPEKHHYHSGPLQITGGHQLRGVIEDYGARDGDKSINRIDVRSRNTLQSFKHHQPDDCNLLSAALLPSQTKQTGRMTNRQRKVYNPGSRLLLYSQ